MKKYLITLILCIVNTIGFAQNAREGYVDLGLPSGTLWKATNEPELYTYTSAVYYCRNNLPNKEQFEELMYNCTWHWTGKGYQVTGPNRNTLYFPFDGYRDCDEEMYDVGVRTFIWTIECSSTRYSYLCALHTVQRDFIQREKCYGASVRLVIN